MNNQLSLKSPPEAVALGVAPPLPPPLGADATAGEEPGSDKGDDDGKETLAGLATDEAAAGQCKADDGSGGDDANNKKAKGASHKTWDETLADLAAFKAANGHCDVTDRSTHLGRWVDVQRTRRKGGKLPPEQEGKLNELGFTWGKPREVAQENVGWEGRLDQLRRYREEFGHCSVPKVQKKKEGGEVPGQGGEGGHAAQYGKLAIWVCDQRIAKRKGKLSQDRVDILDELGFDWNPRKKSEGVGAKRKQRAKRKFAKVKKVPKTKIASLSLTAEAMFGAKDGQADAAASVQVTHVPWAARIAQLRELKRRTGGFDVSGYAPEDEEIRSWMVRQCWLKKRGALADERVKELEDEGFDWSGPKPRKPGPRGLKRGEAAGGEGERGEDDGKGKREESRRKASASKDGEVNLLLAVYPGALGITAAFDGTGDVGVRITHVSKSSNMRGRVDVGDRLVTVDGVRVTTQEDLVAGKDKKLRVFGFATSKGSAKEGARKGSAASVPAKKNSGGEGDDENGEAVKNKGRDGGAARTPTSGEEGKWEAQYANLLTFMRRYGHSNVKLRDTENPMLARWVKMQRYKYAKGMLSDRRVGRLNDINFVWKPRKGCPKGADRPSSAAGVGYHPAHFEKKWDEVFVQLVRFAQENGHVKPEWNGPHSQLRKWVDRQRKAYLDGRLSQDRMTRLMSLGVDLEAPKRGQVSYDDRLAQLAEYARQFGNCDVPLSHPVLGRWVWNQRDVYKKMNVSDDRVKSLEKAGFEWQLTFEERIMQLQQYVTLHGNSNVPQTHVILGQWVQEQRQLYRRNELAEECVAMLNGLGFVWSTAPPRVGWDMRYDILRQYYLETGHCNVPRSHPQLGCWVDNQRRAYKKGKLAPERILALNQLGFNWGTIKKNPELSWQDQYNMLLAFKERHGHANVPQRDGTGLGRWVHWQRRMFKTGKLSAERMNLLNQIDFNWGTEMPRGPTISWDERLAELQKYKAENGNVQIAKKNERDQNGLGTWLRNQRNKDKFASLSDERKNSLIALGVTPIGKIMVESWEENFGKLLEHKQAHGDCNVVQGMDGDLVKWVDRQRRNHKTGILSEERVERLRSVGFEFDPRAVVDFYLAIQSSGRGMGLKVDFDDKTVGAKISEIDSSTPFKGKVSVGDRLLTLNGTQITNREDLVDVGGDQTFGIARKKTRKATKKKGTKSREGVVEITL